MVKYSWSMAYGKTSRMSSDQGRSKLANSMKKKLNGKKGKKGKK